MRILKTNVKGSLKKIYILFYLNKFEIKEPRKLFAGKKSFKIGMCSFISSAIYIKIKI